jgi:hypothetical protein
MRKLGANRTTRVAVLLAVVSVAAACVAAVGPAERERAVYAWPPASLPAERPSRAWYTPLLLVARTPELLEARIPCRLAPPLPATGADPVVLATARNPRLIDGLEARLAGETLTVTVGRERLGRFALPAGEGEGCAVELSIDGTEWSATEADGTLRSGRLAAAPEVTSLFTQLDLRAGPGPSVRLTTQTFATTQTTRQRVAALVATLAALAALLLIAGPVLRLPRGVVRRLVGALRVEDAVVTVALLGWWILAPVPYDDGWVKVRQDVQGYLGELSNYYDHFGVSLPLGYWLEWLERFAVSSADGLAIGRIPALLALFLCWALTRVAARLALGRIADGRTARVVLTTAFVASAVAWGMTLRPESFVAALVGAVLVTALVFQRRPSSAPLAASAPLIALGFTAHPAGLATAAPLLAVSPTIVRWARRTGANAWLALVAGIVATGALALTLLTLDADLETRRRAADIFRSGGYHSLGFWDEPGRYRSVLQDSPAIQRLFLLLVFLVLALYLTRRRTPRTPLLDVPARSLAIAMALLAFTPSKISWHLGILIVAAAVALTAETMRLARESEPTAWRSARAYLAVGALLGFAWWAWRERGLVSKLDVRTEGWRLRTEDWVTLTQLTVAVAVAVLVVLAVREVRRNGRRGLSTAAPAAVPLVLLIVVVPLAGFPYDRITEDALFTDGWTLPRQNVDTLLGRRTCGLADDALVPDRASFTPLPVAGSGGTGAATQARFPAGAVTPWYRLPADRRVGFAVQGFPDSERSPFVVEWAVETLSGPDVVERSSEGLEDGSTYTDDRLGTRFMPWRFLSQGDMRGRPSEATLMRVRVPPNEAGVWIERPVAYDTMLMQEVIGGRLQLPVPNYRLFLPCARLPSIAGGVMEVPHTLVLRSFGDYPPVGQTGTAYGLLDLYRLHYLPTMDSPRRTEKVRVFVVDERIPGTALAPVERLTP